MLARCLSGHRFNRMQPKYIQYFTEASVAGIQPALPPRSSVPPALTLSRPCAGLRLRSPLAPRANRAYCLVFGQRCGGRGRHNEPRRRRAGALSRRNQMDLSPSRTIRSVVRKGPFCWAFCSARFGRYVPICRRGRPCFSSRCRTGPLHRRMFRVRAPGLGQSLTGHRGGLEFPPICF